MEEGRPIAGSEMGLPAKDRSAPNRCATATGPASGSASIAVLAYRDMPVIQELRIEIANVRWRAESERQAEHLVEVAIVEGPLPTDRERVPAHDACGRHRIICVHKLVHVTLVIATAEEKFQEAADRHVCNCIERIK